MGSYLKLMKNKEYNYKKNSRKNHISHIGNKYN
mgnify:FL=1